MGIDEHCRKDNYLYVKNFVNFGYTKKFNAMKKIYFFTFLYFVLFNSNAQNPLTAAKIPVLGDVETYKDADTTGITPGTAGINQLWNYSSIVFSPTAAVTVDTYTTPSSAPNAGLFPTANLASTDGMGNFNMFSTTASSMSYLGNAVATASNCNVYSNPFLFMSYPFAYGSTINDTYAFSGSGLNGNGTTTMTADGTGTLVLPGPTIYPNVMRIRLIQSVAYTGAFTGNFFGYYYAWYSSTQKFPLLTIQTSTFSSSFGTSIDKSVDVNNLLALGVENYSGVKEMFELYPNPASEEVNIKLLYTKNDNEITIYNTLGEVCKTLHINGTQDITKLDIKDLKSGIYFLKLNSEKDSRTEKLIIR